jgi:hypothetical protein
MLTRPYSIGRRRVAQRDTRTFDDVVNGAPATSSDDLYIRNGITGCIEIDDRLSLGVGERDTPGHETTPFRQ